MEVDIDMVPNTQDPNQSQQNDEDDKVKSDDENMRRPHKALNFETGENTMSNVQNRISQFNNLSPRGTQGLGGQSQWASPNTNKQNKKGSKTSALNISHDLYIVIEHKGHEVPTSFREA